MKEKLEMATGGADWGSWAAWASVTVVVIGVIAAAFRHVHGRIAQVDQKHDGKSDALHARVNDVRDNFVRRDDLKEHLDRLERSQSQLVQAVDRLSGQVGDMKVQLARSLADDGE